MRTVDSVVYSVEDDEVGSATKTGSVVDTDSLLELKSVADTDSVLEVLSVTEVDSVVET